MPLLETLLPRSKACCLDSHPTSVVTIDSRVAFTASQLSPQHQTTNSLSVSARACAPYRIRKTRARPWYRRASLAAPRYCGSRASSSARARAATLRCSTIARLTTPMAHTQAASALFLCTYCPATRTRTEQSSARRRTPMVPPRKMRAAQSVPSASRRGRQFTPRAAHTHGTCITIQSSRAFTTLGSFYSRGSTQGPARTRTASPRRL